MRVRESKGLAIKELEGFNATLSEWVGMQERVVAHLRALLSAARGNGGRLPDDESARAQPHESIAYVRAALSHLRTVPDLHGALRAAQSGLSELRELHARGVAAEAVASAAGSPSTRLSGKDLKAGAFKQLAAHLPDARARCGAIGGWSRAALQRYRWQPNAGARRDSRAPSQPGRARRSEPDGDADESEEDAESSHDGDVDGSSDDGCSGDDCSGDGCSDDGCSDDSCSGDGCSDDESSSSGGSGGVDGGSDGDGDGDDDKPSIGRTLKQLRQAATVRACCLRACGAPASCAP